MAKAGMPVFRYDWGLASHCMCYDPRAHRVCEVHGSVPNLTQELKSKNGFIEAHGLTEEPTERPKSS